MMSVSGPSDSEAGHDKHLTAFLAHCAAASEIFEICHEKQAP